MKPADPVAVIDIDVYVLPSMVVVANTRRVCVPGTCSAHRARQTACA